MNPASCLRATLLVLLTAPACAHAQSAPPTLPQVLARAQANFAHFQHTVPPLAVNEHLTASVGTVATTAVSFGGNTSLGHGAEADAIFTLQRDPSTAALTESRAIKTIDGRPLQPNAPFVAPTMLTGAFSYAGAFLQPELTTCYDYKLKPNQKLQGHPALVVEFDHDPAKQPSGASCMIADSHSGRAFLDPDTLQVLRIELHRPSYTTTLQQPNEAGGDDKLKLTVSWDWTIDYTPVQLDGQSYLLPKTINSTMKTLPRAEKTTHWTLVADYRNYHSIAATSAPRQ